MEQAEIRELVTGVPVGTELKMTFVRESPSACMLELYREIVAGHLRLSPGDEMLFHIIKDSNDWGANRILHATTTHTFDPAAFANQLFRVVESLKVQETVTKDYFVFIDVEANQARLVKDNGRETRLLSKGADPLGRAFVKRLPRQAEAKALVDLINGSLEWVVFIFGNDCEDAENDCWAVTYQYAGSGLMPGVEPEGTFATSQEAFAAIK